MKHLIFGLLFLLGCFFLIVSIHQYNETRFLLKNGITAKAIVIDDGEQRVKDGYEYTPIFEYQDKENNTITFVSSATSDSELYNVGDSVEIIYCEDEPLSERTISFFDLYGLAIICFIIGLVFSATGVVYFVYWWRNK